MGKKVFIFVILATVFSLKAVSQLHPAPKPTEVPTLKKNFLLPQNFYSQHLSFFCKKESQLQKATGLNLFIRLGSKDYVDYLEQKPNAVKAY